MLELQDVVVQYDQELLIYLHQLGTVYWDSFWVFVTNPLHWIPLFIFLFYLGFRTYGFKKAIVITLWTSFAVIVALNLMKFIKNTFQRLRPIHDQNIQNSLRKIIETDGFSFISGHSMVSFTIATIAFLVFRKHYKYSFLIYLFPILFAYSRMYLALHYPSDILAGMLVGIALGNLFYLPLKKYLQKT